MKNQKKSAISSLKETQVKGAVDYTEEPDGF
jgi:hypothetical protein